jgi:signal transduction histidine kinase
MTPLEIIVELTGLKTAEARKILQKTIFNLESTSIPVSQFITDRDFLLHIQPLTFEDSQDHFSNSASTLQVEGILIEFEDVTYLKAIYHLKEQIFERLVFQLQRELTTAQSDLTAYNGQVGGIQQENTSSIAAAQDKIKTILVLLDSVSEELNREVENVTFDLGRYPIDGLPAIKKAVAELNDYAVSRMIVIHSEWPNLLGLVFASPNELYRVFHTLLTMTIDDTLEGEQIWITAEDGVEWVNFHFRNIGIGISYKKQQGEDQDESAMPAKKLAIDQAFDYVRCWGGRLEISSQVGKGSTITLQLKRFL